MIYFASDFHLGAPNYDSSREREEKICRWLDTIKDKATELFLLGDIFDFWFEYKTVVPKGYVRFLGKLAELRDGGVDVHICVGNHDLWLADYLIEEIGVRIFREPETIVRQGVVFHIHHGDGLGPGDQGYKRLKKVFTNSFAQFVFSKLHPNLGINLANRASRKSRIHQPEKEKKHKSDEEEYLTLYSEEQLKENPLINYFIFGHRHSPLDVTLSNKKSHYINLGEWFSGSRYVTFDGEQVLVCNFD